jgi:hypothetical protein
MTEQDHQKAGSKLTFQKVKDETDKDYAAYRCTGPRGCGERVTFDALAGHAAKQHDLFDFDVVNELKSDG